MFTQEARRKGILCGDPLPEMPESTQLSAWLAAAGIRIGPNMCWRLWRDVAAVTSGSTQPLPMVVLVWVKTRHVYACDWKRQDYNVSEKAVW